MFDLSYCSCYFVLVVLIILILLFFIRVMSSGKLPEIIRFEEEKYFLDPAGESSKQCLFPSLHDQYSLELSIIIPAYNEEKRLPVMLDECTTFLEERLKNDPTRTYEIIVVDDGSIDRTTEVALNYVRKFGADKFRVLSLKQNRGKGGAVRLGMLSARGKLLLFADADGATKFCDIKKLEESMEKLCKLSDYCVTVGSRAHLEKQAVATRSTFRTFLMFGFHALVWLFGVRNVRDTQCGFKLFTRKAAVALFKSLHVERWAFDVELLYIANQLSMQISEVAVNWTEIEGSKLVPFWSWLQMGIDLVLIWLKYQTRLWEISSKEKDT